MNISSSLILKPKSISLLNIIFRGVVVVFVKNLNFKPDFLNFLTASIDPGINYYHYRELLLNQLTKLLYC